LNNIKLTEEETKNTDQHNELFFLVNQKKDIVNDRELFLYCSGCNKFTPHVSVKTTYDDGDECSICKNITYNSFVRCTNCGWGKEEIDEIPSDNIITIKQKINEHFNENNYETEYEIKCPICNTIFTYFDI